MASSGSEYHNAFKIIIVGDRYVGKASIQLRIVHDKFYKDPEAFPEFSYIGIDSTPCIKDINGQLVMLNIWDYDDDRRFDDY